MRFYFPALLLLSCLPALSFPNYSYNEKDTVPILLGDTLRDVRITAKAITNTIDGYRVNIAAQPILQNNDLWHLLSFLPGVTTTDDKITVNGKQVSRVYVNDHLVPMESKDLKQYLSTFDGKRIQDIQVILSVGSNIDATLARSAILRIRSRSISDGGNATISTTGFLSSKIRSLTLPSANIELRSGHWSLYGSTSIVGTTNTIERENSTNFLSSSNVYAELADNHQHSNNYQTTLGIGYDFTPKDILTLEAYYHRRNQDTDGKTRIIMSTGDIENSFQNKDNGNIDQLMLNTTVSYLHQWKTGKLTIAGSFVMNDNHSNNDIHRYDNEQLWHVTTQNATARHHEELYADIDQQLPGTWGQIQGGLLSSTWVSKEENQNVMIQNGLTIPYSTFNEFFKYKEQNYAGYCSWKYNNNAFSASVGLRYEFRLLDPQQEFQTTDNSRSRYSHFFPSIHLGYDFNRPHGHRLDISYSQSATIPHMRMLNPAIHWESQYTYTTGNPYLQPAYGYELMSTLTVWHNFRFTASMNHNSEFENIFLNKEGSDVYYSTYINGEETNDYYFSFSGNKMINRKFIVNASSGYCYSHRNYQGTEITDNSFNAHLSTIVMLPASLRLTLSGLFYSKKKWLTMKMAERWQASANLNWQTAKNRLFISLGYIYVPRCNLKIYTPGVEVNSLSLAPLNRFTISLRYNLSWGHRGIKVRHSSSVSSEGRRGAISTD